jgi:hypothetical protein
LYKLLVLSAGIAFQLLAFAADEIPQHKQTSLSGIVRDAFLDELDAHYHFFVIQNETGTHYATTKSPSVDHAYVSGLIGAEVTISGIVDPASPPNRQYLGQAIFFDGTNAVQVLKPAPQNPFAVPEIEDFNFYSTQASSALACAARTAEFSPSGKAARSCSSGRGTFPSRASSLAIANRRAAARS